MDKTTMTVGLPTNTKQPEQIYGVPVNPQLDPAPRPWWINSFQYFQAFPLLESNYYGPFYRVDGETFEPVIGSEEEFSEKACFYGFVRPKNSHEAKILYKPHCLNPCSHLHEFFISIPKECKDALLFIGPVSGGTSWQVGINSIVCQFIKNLQADGKVTKTPLSA